MLACDRHHCLNCAGCIALCLETALSMDLHGLTITHDFCTLCGICVRFCPVAALTMEGSAKGIPAGIP